MNRSMRVLATALLGFVLSGAGPAAVSAQGTVKTATPIKHLVVIFDENVSFDHYFGTYPHALNPAGEPTFTPAPGTPAVNGLTPDLLAHNPNLANPRRLDRSEALTCDQDHDYGQEQRAFNNGQMDRFVEFTSGLQCTDKTLVMDYYDGNTVTALWNYAQRFAMSDNFFATTFGPSTPGALNLVSGQTHGATPPVVPYFVANGTVIGDPEPAYDACADPNLPHVSLDGKNVGDLLNARGVTWGWFQGGFRPTSAPGAAPTCGAAHQNIGGQTIADYVPHHEPFQYYASTANPSHLPPTSPAKIGKTDQANHQYDLTDFWQAASAGNQPAVSFLKAPAYQNGHAGNSDPLDEQRFLVETLNRLQTLPTWNDTAVIVTYDDSDGWYDHQMSPIVNFSNDPANDGLTAPGICGGLAAVGAYQDRCGHGPRLPLLVISPYALPNSVDHTATDQASILRFIEDNWALGRIGDQSFDAGAGSLAGLFNFGHGPRATPLSLDPATGQPR